MSSTTPIPPVPTDEAGIERVVREILFPLDQRLELALNWGCSIFGLLLAPGLALLLWLGFGANGWLALLVSCLGLFLVWMLLARWLDDRAVTAAVRRFNDRFPLQHPSRGVAVQMLSEMECPNKAQDKLRAAL